MNVSPFRLLSLTLFLILSADHATAAGGFLRQNAKIVFDKTNFLVFEDVGRQESKNAITHGKKVVIHATRDGKPIDYDLTALQLPNAPLSTQVMEIRYRDKDRIWILSRLGHRLGGAVLYNLATRKADWTVAGVHFALSPDARHLAFSFPMDPQFNRPMVFVNTVMVYPRVEPGFTRKPDYDPPKKEDGTDSWNLLTKDQRRMTLASEIKWLNNGEIEFTVRPADEDTGKQSTQFKQSTQTIHVSGLEDLKSINTIKTNVVTSGTQESKPRQMPTN